MMISLHVTNLAELATGRRKRSAVNRAIKAALSAAAAAWHRDYYERHFTPAGARLYGYYRRKGEGMAPGSKPFRRSYTGRKLARFGHADPLKFTGEGFQRGKVSRIVATRRQAKVVLPSVFNYRHPKSRIDMRAELTRVLDPEAAALREIAAAEMPRHLAT